MLKRKHVKGLLVLLVLIAASSALFFGCRKHGFNKSPEKFAEYIVDKISSELELDDNQKQFVNTVKETLLTKVKECKNERLAKRKEFLALLKSDVIDQEKVKTMIAEHRAKMDEIIPQLVSRLAEFHAMLRPEQKEKLVKLLEKHESKCPFNSGDDA